MFFCCLTECGFSHLPGCFFCSLSECGFSAVYLNVVFSLAWMFFCCLAECGFSHLPGCFSAVYLNVVFLIYQDALLLFG